MKSRMVELLLFVGRVACAGDCDCVSVRPVSYVIHPQMAALVARGLAAAAPLLARLAAMPPVEYAASMSYRGWVGVALVSLVSYLYQSSLLSSPSRNKPCPSFGVIFRLMYRLFGTALAEWVLNRAVHTRPGEEQAEQVGGTRATTIGKPEMRIKMVPILGQMFGGNYAFLIWDESDTQRRAIAVDPADPEVVLRAADADALKIEIVLTTHWHWDHSSGNRAMAMALKGLEVVASAEERGRTPAVTRRLADLEEITLGDLVVRGHAVPGHTRGSMVYEVFSKRADNGTPSSAFTGDTLFCGGCGALFECSSNTLYASLRLLVARLPMDTLIFPGHEYTEMLLTMCARRDPGNAIARDKLVETRLKRARKEPSLPSTMREELAYNPHLKANPDELALMCGCATEEI